MKRSRIVILAVVVAVVGAIAITAVLVSALGGGGSPFARLLPADTIAYLSLENVEEINAALEDTGLMDKLVDDAPHAPDGRAMLEASRELQKKTRAVHISFHGMSGSPHRPMPNLLIVNELSEPDAIEALPDVLRERLSKDGSAGDVTLYRLNIDDEPETAYLAGLDHRLFISTDRQTLRTALDGARGAVKDSLAAAPEHRKVIKALPNGDLRLYVSVGALLDMIRPTLSNWDRREFDGVTAAMGLREVSAGAATLARDGGSLTVALNVDPDAAVYDLLTQRPAKKALASVAPADALFFAAYSVSDGREGWTALEEHIAEALTAIGEARDRERFEEGLREVENRLGAAPDQIAALVEEIGLCITTEDDDPVVLARVNDVDRAGEIVEKMWDDSPIRREQRNGVTVHIVDDRWTRGAWAFIDDVLVLADDVDLVELVLNAHHDGESLADADAYRDVLARLPSSNVALAYWNVDQTVTTVGVDRTELTGGLREWVDGLALGAALTAGGDIVTLRVVTTKAKPLADMIRIAAEQANLFMGF